MQTEFWKRTDDRDQYSDYLDRRKRMVYDGDIVDVGSHAAAAKTTHVAGAEYTVFDIGAG